MKTITKEWGHGGKERLRLDKRRLISFAKSLGAAVEDDSSGSWNVLQLVAPSGKLWKEGICCIKVEWPCGESSEPACRDAYSRLSAMGKDCFRPMLPSEQDFYSNE